MENSPAELIPGQIFLSPFQGSVTLTLTRGWALGFILSPLRG